jgi:dihydrolipoamide dehydrogenase
VVVDRVLVCIGRRSNLDRLGVDRAGIRLNAKGLPEYNRNTMQVEDQPVFLAGDVDGERPLLHEAADEGRIAGINATLDKPLAFRRKTPLYITFSDPNIVLVGQRFSELDQGRVLIGGVNFGMLGRALIMGRNKGQIRLYADKSTGRLLGASMVAPHGEHLGHLLNWSMEQGVSVQQMVRFPFYHPVLEEAIQPVLRDLVAQSGLGPEDYPPDLELL